MTKQIAVNTPTMRKYTPVIQTPRHDNIMETNQRLAEAYIARFVVIKFGYVM